MYKKIKKIMEENKISAYQLSKKIGITPTSFTDWKNQKAQPSMKAIKKIADYFEVPVEYFFEDDSENLDQNISIKITDSTLQNSEVTGIKNNFLSSKKQDEYIKKVSELMEEMTTEGKERMIDQAEFLKSKYKK